MENEMNWILDELLGLKGCYQWHEIHLEVCHHWYTPGVGTGASNSSSFMTWMMGHSSPSASLQMIQSWEKPLINHMVMLSIRRTWQATERAWNEPQVHQGEKIKSWPWGTSASPTWGLTSCKAACKAEMDPRSWWTKSRTWAAMSACGKDITFL